MKASKPILALRNLSVFRENIILQSIDWQVLPGQHWVILGPNGSGKTSLLNALTAYLTPSTGEIFVLGRTYGKTDWRELRKKIGLVSSSLRSAIGEGETALKAVVSGRKAMLNYWGEISPFDRKRGMKILKEVECEDLKDRPWGVLSQGEQQRVLIGRALMSDYRLLLLDEPCAGLDLVARERFLNFLRRLVKQWGRKRHSPTLIFVTHHVEEILPVFSHVLLLAKGRVVISGKKSEVLKSPILSRAYEVPIRIGQKGGRYSAQVRGKSKFIA